MNNLKKTIILCFVLFSCFIGAKADVEINETTFPDEKFRNWVLSKSYGEDGVLTDEEISGIKKIIVSKNGVHSLKGIEYFTELTYLYCSAIQLEELDVSRCTKLEELDCVGNQLTSLDVSQNTKLTTLYCKENQLTSLDVSQNTALKILQCDSNPLTSIDVSKNTALETLLCKDIQLTELDVSKNVELKWLVCNNNQLTKLDVTNLTKLEDLRCLQNRLERIIVSGCDNLSAIFCHNNQIKGEAIDELIEGLPFKPGERGLLCIVNTEDEQNVMTKAQVAAAKAKGWIPCYKYGTFGEYDYPDYEGIDEATNIGATLNDKGQMTNDGWYDLQGRKIGSGKSFPLKGARGSGIYIEGGKKKVK